MSISAGNLRHRITIEKKMVTGRHPVTGTEITEWVPLWEGVPAEVVPLSVREFVAAQSVQSKLAARIRIRWRPGVDASMRILHDGRIYNIEGVLPDPDSGRAYLTLPCSEGVNDG